MEPVAQTKKVAVICLLSSSPLIGIFFDPFDENVYFPAAPKRHKKKGSGLE